MEHDPIEDLKLLHCDMAAAAGMINTMIEETLGEECTPADIRNGLLPVVISDRCDILECA